MIGNEFCTPAGAPAAATATRAHAAAAGIKAVIQPGGSMNDQKVIDAADEANLTMVFTGMRHFKH